MMEPEQFNGKAGSAKMAQNAIYYTFTPNPLPPKITYDDELISLLSEANLKLGKLNGMGRWLPNPHLLIRPYMAKEAVLSSKIEGTKSSLSDVFKYEAEEKEGAKEDPDVREVVNYITALEQGSAEIEKKELEIELILELHKTLLGGVRGETKEPGRLRNRQNWIGTSYNIEEATFVPPAPGEVEPLLRNLFSYLNALDNAPLLVKIGLGHYQFETIHPFRDGNGRMGRLLIILFLLKKKALSLPLLYMSAYFERNRLQYYDELLNVSKTGDYERWLKFFMRGVVAQAEDAIARTEKLDQYRKKHMERIKSEGSVNAIRIFEELFYNPFITVPFASRKIGKQYLTAKAAIDILEKEGIVREMTGQKRNKIYVSDGILKILENERPR